MLLVHNMNLDLTKVGVKNHSELSFKKIVRRGDSRRGPVRLREDEKEKYLIV